MTIIDIIVTALKFLLELWNSAHKTPEEAKLAAVAKVTKEMNKDVESFEKSLADGDALALSEHFEQLRLRVLKNSSG